MASSANPNPPTTDASSWRKGGESTPATTRGAGRSRGAGRGGGRTSARGGGLGGRSAAPTTARSGRSGDNDNRKMSPIATESTPSESASAVLTDTVATKPPTNGDSASRSKPSRRGSRQVPTLVVDPSSPVTPTANAPATAPLPSSAAPAMSRRKRSQNRGKGASPIAPATLPSTDPIKEDTPNPPDVDSTPTEPVVVPASSMKPKDMPPHLLNQKSAPAAVTTFEARAKVDSLVERMRTSAMARPQTPTNHIDWAGDDDDSLPDLDEWGYGSKTDTDATSGSSPHEDVISPILEGSLKALPLLHTPDVPLTPEADDTAETPTVTKAAKGELLASAAPTKEQADTSSGPNVQDTPRKRNAVDQATPRAPKGASREEKGKSRRGTRTKAGSLTSTTSAKGSPVDTQPPAKSIPAKSQDVKATRGAPTTSPVSLPPKPEAPPLHPSLPARPVVVKFPVSRPGPSPKAPPLSSLPPNTAASAETHPPPSTANEKPSSSPPAVKREQTSPKRGLAASIHAPKQPVPPSDPQFAPGHVTEHSSANCQPAVSASPDNRARSRASTGRPVRALQSSPTGPSFRPTTTSNARAPVHSANHTRTQSTPVHPTRGGAPGRAAHAVRPVITVDAISKLMRDLGGSKGGARNASPGRAEIVAADK